MSCSLLFEINNDLSDIVGKYLKTIRNNKKLQQEFLKHVKNTLIKGFNIDTYRNSGRCIDIQSRNPILYWKPRGRIPIWVWTDKRAGNGFINNHFLKMIVMTGKNKGYCCSCMKHCRWRKCPERGERWNVLQFPKKVLDLHTMGYYSLKSLMNEIKEPFISD